MADWNNDKTKFIGSPIMALQEEQVREALKQVIDPELFVNIVEPRPDLRCRRQAGR